MKLSLSLVIVAGLLVDVPKVECGLCIVRIALQRLSEKVFRPLVVTPVMEQQGHVVPGPDILRVYFENVLKGGEGFLLPSRFLQSDTEVVEAFCPVGSCFQRLPVLVNRLGRLARSLKGDTKVVAQRWVPFIGFEASLIECRRLGVISKLFVQISKIVVSKHKTGLFRNSLLIPGFCLIHVPGAFEKICKVVADIGVVRQEELCLLECF